METNADSSSSVLTADMNTEAQIRLLHLEKLFQNSIDPVCVAGFDGFFKWINPAFNRILGYSTNELLLEPYMNFVHPEDINATIAEASKLAGTSVNTLGFVNRYRKKDGDYAYFKWNVVPDPVQELLYCSIRDITGQMEAEDQRHQAREIVALILEGIQAGIWKWNILSGEEWWSPKFYEILGYPEATIEPTYENFLQILHPEDYKRVIDAIDNHLKNKAKYVLDIRIKTQTGEYKWIQTSGQAEWDILGNPLKMYGTILDINENKNKEKDLQHSLELINEQNQRLVDFSHIISHNLRSHTSNFGMLISLYETIPDSISKQEIFEKIKQTFVNLNETIETLNKVVQLKSGYHEQKENLSFETVLDHVLKNLEPQINASQAVIHIDFTAAPSISHVPAYLESIFYNLVSNAIKYRQPRKTPVIHLSTQKEKGKTLLSVSDNGLGMDMKAHGDKIFGMYKTFHGNSDAKGLGLFMTKNQIEALGGRITVESEPGKGSTFKIYF
ncbi:MAG: PAS domain-containing protein [Bacteroidia bacterium]